MTLEELQNDIASEGGFIVSDGTMLSECITPKIYDLLVAYELNEKLQEEIKSCFNQEPTFEAYFYGRLKTNDREKLDMLLYEDIFEYLNEIAPEKMYFGATEGDGACYGFFFFYGELFDQGEKVTLESTPEVFEDFFSEANWITDEIEVKLLEDAVEGSNELFNVELKNGENKSVYGFNIVV